MKFMIFSHFLPFFCQPNTPMTEIQEQGKIQQEVNKPEFNGI